MKRFIYVLMYRQLFWIKKNDSWAKFHKKFKDFEKEYLVIMSIIRQTRDLQKLIDEVMNHIAKRWKFNSRIFKILELHTLRAIKKCARADYIMKSILQRLKLAVMYRLRNSERNISRAILSNVIDWARVIDDLFDSERVTVEELRQFNLLHRESFFSRQKHEFVKMKSLST
jgi:mevalonate kinase